MRQTKNKNNVVIVVAVVFFFLFIPYFVTILSVDFGFSKLSSFHFLGK
jgi:hypothetical protein